MKDIDFTSRVHAEMPWVGSARQKPKVSDGQDSLRYRGWTLVDDKGWRWASKGTCRIRICHDHGVGHAEAIAEFHRRVDEHEEG